MFQSLVKNVFHRLTIYLSSINDENRPESKIETKVMVIPVIYQYLICFVSNMVIA